MLMCIVCVHVCVCGNVYVVMCMCAYAYVVTCMCVPMHMW